MIFALLFISVNLLQILSLPEVNGERLSIAYIPIILLKNTVKCFHVFFLQISVVVCAWRERIRKKT